VSYLTFAVLIGVLKLMLLDMANPHCLEVLWASINVMQVDSFYVGQPAYRVDKVRIISTNLGAIESFLNILRWEFSHKNELGT